MAATVDAISRVVTRNGIGRIAIDSSASISSAMRIAPNCAVNRHPACMAKASAAMIGASSRVFTSDEMKPVAGPRPEQIQEVVALDARRARRGNPEHHRDTRGSAAHDD